MTLREKVESMLRVGDFGWGVLGRGETGGGDFDLGETGGGEFMGLV